MKVLVTGATGFFGNYVVIELLKRNVEVITTSRDVEKAKRFVWYPEVRYIPGDISENRQNFFKYFRRPDCVIHLAWDGLENYKNLLHFETNLLVHYNFIKNMVQHGLEQIVVTGSCLEYGQKCGLLSEDCETKPVVAYGLAKDTLRKFLEHLFHIYPVVFQWVRVFYIYGRGQSERSLVSLLETAITEGKESFDMTGGEQLRDYLPVEKAAEYVVAIASQKKVEGIINCCSGKAVSVRNFVENYFERKRYSLRLNLGQLPYPDYEPMAFWGDNRKMKSILEGK